MKRKTQHPETLAVHAGDRKKLGDYVSTTTPIFSTSSFFYERTELLDEVFEGRREGHGYTRYGNPTCAAFEEQISALEGADFAIATASGMAALHLGLLTALTDRRRKMVAALTIYGQTLSMLTKIFEPLGVEVILQDPYDLEAWGRTIAEERPACVLLETISNPLLRVPQLDKAAAAAKAQGAYVVVDATFTTPVLMQPLELGADLVIHSATKYLAGHGDVLGGVLLGREELRDAAQFLSRNLGPVLGPFECYLAMRGTKTLLLRFERQCANAVRAAAWLAEQDVVERVYFPGDPAHQDHAVARRLFRDGLFGAMVSFDLAGGREAALAFMDALEMTVPATSLGDIHTMALYPPMSSHRDLAPKQRLRMGIGEGLVRLSIGIENVDDILADFRQAFEAVRRVGPTKVLDEAR